METEPQSSPAPDRRIALLIDADNVSHTKLAAIQLIPPPGGVA